MNLYIDPKDMPVTTGDKVLAEAWEERKKMRADLYRLTKQIEAMDQFIATYIERVNPSFTQFQQFIQNDCIK